MLIRWKNKDKDKDKCDKSSSQKSNSVSSKKKRRGRDGVPKRNLTLKFSKATKDAVTPSKGSARAAGYDLHSSVHCTVPAHGKHIVDTGIKIELPEGCYGRIAPRSGLAARDSIDVGAGVVDEDYRGVLKVVLFNHSDRDFRVEKGDRIAQLICSQIFYPDMIEADLSDTCRGEKGFGSTGIK